MDYKKSLEFLDELILDLKEENKEIPKSLFDYNNDKLNIFVVKTSLKSILKNYTINQPKINKLVIECNDIVIRTYQFIRLYIYLSYINI